MTRPANIIKTSTVNRGRPLEVAVMTSQRGVICVDKTSAGAKFLPRGKVVLKKGPVDYVGEIVGTGRAIHFDAKQTEDVKGFRLSDIAPHQLLHLERHHDAGVLAGVLAECTDEGVAAFFWIGWPLVKATMRQGLKVVPWAGAVRLGSNKLLIDFTSIPEIGGHAM